MRKYKFLFWVAVSVSFCFGIALFAMIIGTSTPSSASRPKEYIIYTYELKGQEFAALQQRYLSADEATKEELTWEIGCLLGFSDNSIRRQLSYGENVIDSLMTNSISINLSKRYLVSDGNGSVENVSEEDAYRIAAEINATREAAFQAEIQKILGK